MIGKTIEMWWWCREGKEKIEVGGGGGAVKYLNGGGEGRGLV